MKTLKYDYMDKVVELKAIKSGCCDGYFLVEQLDPGHEPQIIAGPYLTKKATLIAGQKYIEGKIIMKKREATEDEGKYFDELEDKAEYAGQYDGSFEASKGDYEGACLARAEFEAGYIA